MNAFDMLFMLFGLFVLKHFLVDYVFQTPYQYLNKGKVFHLGGWIHAGLHGLATYAILFLVFKDLMFAITWSSFDMLTHYVIDYMRVNLARVFKRTSVDDNSFWWLTGFDQMLHYMVYIRIIHAGFTFMTQIP